MTEAGSGDIPLRWDVFMEPGIPIATCDLPPDLKQQAMFQAMAQIYCNTITNLNLLLW